MECKFQVEIDPFCTKVLEKHWPNVRRYEDVRKVHGALGRTHHERGGSMDGEFLLGGEAGDCPSCLPAVDLICGGFPCQPFSVAGKQRGKEDDRHLWPEMFRIVSELRPTWVVGENVPGLVRLGLDEVLSDLEGIGYSTQTFDIPACAVDAPHVRHRVWIVANAQRGGCGSDGECGSMEGVRGGRAHDSMPVTESGTRAGEDVAYADLQGPQGRDGAVMRKCSRERIVGAGDSHDVPDPIIFNDDGTGYGTGTVCGEQRGPSGLQGCGSRWLPEPGMGGLAHGLPGRLVRSRFADGSWEEGIPRVEAGVKGRVSKLRAFGNAVYPLIPEIIGRGIMESEGRHCGL